MQDKKNKKTHDLESPQKKTKKKPTILNIINTIPKQLQKIDDSLQRKMDKNKSNNLLNRKLYNNNQNSSKNSEVIREYNIKKQEYLNSGELGSGYVNKEQNHQFAQVKAASNPSNFNKFSKTLNAFRSKSLSKIINSKSIRRISNTSQVGVHRKKVSNHQAVQIMPFTLSKRNSHQQLGQIINDSIKGNKGYQKSNINEQKQRSNSEIKTQRLRGSQRNTPPTSRERRNKNQVFRFQLDPCKSIPLQIEQYIQKRKEVEIVKYFEQYKKQLYIKSKVLFQYIHSSQDPQKIRNTYLDQSDNHFRNGLESNMLKLFRSGVIVPNSYDNLRQDAVQQIQKWIIGWIHRKIMYGKLVQDQQNQVLIVQDSLKHLQQYKKAIEAQDTSF